MKENAIIREHTIDESLLHITVLRSIRNRQVRNSGWNFRKNVKLPKPRSWPHLNKWHAFYLAGPSHYTTSMVLLPVGSKIRTGLIWHNKKPSLSHYVCLSFRRVLWNAPFKNKLSACAHSTPCLSPYTVD